MTKKILPKKDSKVGLISVSKAAEILGVSPDTLRNWDEEGKIKARRTKGGARRYSLKQLQTLKKELHPSKKRIGLLTVTKAAKELHISADTIRNWDKRGFILGARTKGGARRFSRAEVNRVKKELGIVEKIEYKAEEDLKLKLAKDQIAVTEAKVSKPEPKIRQHRFPVIRFLLLSILFLIVLDLGLILDFKQDTLNNFVSRVSYKHDLDQITSALEKLQKAVSNLQTKQSDNFFLTNGSSLWEISANYLKNLLGQTPSNEQILDLSKQLAKSSNIAVPEWGIFEGVFDHRNLPDGFKLTLNQEETKLGVISNSSNQLFGPLAKVFQVGNYESGAAVTLLGSGNLGIGTLNPESRVQISGGGLCVGSDANCNSDNNTEGVIYASSTSTTVYDLAENYPTKDLSLSPGEVVELDDQNEVFVKRAKSGTSKLLGVISDKPGVLLGGFNGEQFRHEHQVPVALSGRVLVKIASDSVDIEVGDLITSSNQPGKATKATQSGFIVGRALESWKPTDTKNSILVFVSTIYADPNNILANLAFDEQGNIISTKLGNKALNLQEIENPNLSLDPDQLKAKNLVNSLEIAASLEKIQSQTLDIEVKQAQTERELNLLSDRIGQIEANLNRKFEEDRQNLAALESKEKITEKSSQQQPPVVDLSDLTSSETLIATGSATLANIKATETITSEAWDLSVSGVFKALGETFLGNTTIAGNLAIDGVFSIAENSINVVGVSANPGSGILYLQNNSLAQGLDIFNGKILISKEGDIEANSVIVADFKVLADRISGAGLLKKGEKTVFVENNLVDSNSRILITPTSETYLVLAVTKKEDLRGFWVSAPGILEEDLNFDWWMVREI